MERTWIILYLALALMVIVQAALMALQTWENRRFARNRLRELDRYHPQGHATVFAPCKGLDLGLENNLRALLDQDYRDLDVIFVVESAEDSACPVIRRVMRDYSGVRTRLIVAGRSSGSGQKVHNLRVATKDLPPGTDYLVFVDSDARPRREWLRLLLSDLDSPRVGATTGYRWFLPLRPSLANHLVYSINCGIALLMGRGGRHLVWGGSWAIRRACFDALGVRDAWEGTLSDDLVVSRLLERERLEVRFHPPCTVLSPIEQGLGEMFRFLRRQYLVGRFYAPGYWRLAVVAAALTNLFWLSSLALIAGGLWRGTAGVLIPAAASAACYGLGVLRHAFRQDLGRSHFPDHERALRRARRFDLWAGPLVALVNGAALAASMAGNRITWRGNSYRLTRGGRIAPPGVRRGVPGQSAPRRAAA
jgi:cellulose synthase/poly-beta-1,6-N-acetylglucosamine synthase-like glycosyltransferase